VLRQAVTLDADMTVQAALRLLASNGYWLSPDEPEARSRIEAYRERIKGLASRTPKKSAATAHSERTQWAWNAEQDAARVRPRVDPKAMTFEEAARILTRPIDEASVAIFRRDGVTIFWYARDLRHVLQALTQTGSRVRLLDALGLHEYTSSKTSGNKARRQEPRPLRGRRASRSAPGCCRRLRAATVRVG